jgi:hypothetical protein
VGKRSGVRLAMLQFERKAEKDKGERIMKPSDQ